MWPSIDRPKGGRTGEERGRSCVKCKLNGKIGIVLWHVDLKGNIGCCICVPLILGPWTQAQCVTWGPLSPLPVNQGGTSPIIQTQQRFGLRWNRFLNNFFKKQTHLKSVSVSGKIDDLKKIPWRCIALDMDIYIFFYKSCHFNQIKFKAYCSWILITTPFKYKK